MTRRDYIALARAIRDAKPAPGADPVAAFTWRNVAENLTQALDRHAPNFDAAKFRDACDLI